MLNVEFSNKSKSFLRKAEKELEDRILEKIEELRVDPFPKGVEKVKGREGKVWRARVGDYRVIYKVVFEDNNIIISNIGNRENIYD